MGETDIATNSISDKNSSCELFVRKCCGLTKKFYIDLKKNKVNETLKILELNYVLIINLHYLIYFTLKTVKKFIYFQDIKLHTNDCC